MASNIVSLGRRALVLAVVAGVSQWAYGATETQHSGPVSFSGSSGSLSTYPLAMNFTSFLPPPFPGYDTVSSVSITFTLTHPNVGDLDMMLVSPDNSKYIFMSDAFEGTSALNQTFTISDSGMFPMQSSGPIFPGGSY